MYKYNLSLDLEALFFDEELCSFVILTAVILKKNSLIMNYIFWFDFLLCNLG